MKIAIISDIHSNLQALQSVLKDIEKNGADVIFCIGDIIGYGGQPNEVTQEIIFRKIFCCAGNHEASLFNKTMQKTFSVNALLSIGQTEIILNDNNLDFLVSLPNKMKYWLKKDFLFVHGAPPENMEIYLDNPDRDLLKLLFKKTKFDICFVGHTHIPALAEYNGSKAAFTGIEGKMKLNKNFRYIINPGSVGQPRNGNSDSSYMMFDSDKYEIEQIYVKYNINAAARQILKNGFPEFNSERLFLGC